MTIKFDNFDLDNIFIEQNSYKHLLIYNIPYKILIGSKPLRMRFGFIIDYDGTKYLVLFGAEKYDLI